MLSKRLALTSSIFFAVFVPMVACSADPIYYGDPVDTDGGGETEKDGGPGSIKVGDGGKVDGSSKDAGKDASKKDASSKDGSTVKDAGFAPEGSPCSTTKPEETTCGACGTKSRACLDDGSGKTVWGAWGSCIGELVADDACDPEQNYADEDCGNCGKRQRVCGLDCHFVAGLSCTEPTFGSELACSPGSKEFLLGASCLGANQGRYRTCDTACKWSTPGACETFTVNASASTISASTGFACSILPNSKIKCWGDGGYGQLGNGTTTDATTPVEVSGITGAMSLGSGYYHSCAIVSGGAVKCWGYNYYGSLGNGSTSSATQSTPVASLITSGAQAISSGTYHSCAVISGGNVKCWGYNSYGQLGDGLTTANGTPVLVQDAVSNTALTGIAAVSAGANHTCALVSGGTVKCWGYNSYGQLGTGGTAQAYKATVVPNLTGVLAISSGASHTCAILTGGGVKCWGYNYYGQLGNASSTTAYTPVDVSGLTSGALAISAGGSHTCAVVAGGAVKCWGYNSYGALGNGSSTNSNVPVQVQGLTGVSSIAAGANFTCARLSNGAGKCWGYNSYGSLGNGSTASSNVPVNVSNLP